MAMHFAIIWILVLGGGGGNELLDYIPSDVFWKLQGVKVSGETMLAELTGPKPVGDLSALIKQLDAASAADRESAQAKLTAMGPGVLPQIRPLVKSDNPEVAARAAEIVKALSDRQDNRDLRRLMAIRTLGEIKHAAAQGRLKELTTSREPFVGEYARHALAALAGQDLARTGVSQAQRRHDLMLLPENCQVVGQADITGGGGVVQMKQLLAQLNQLPGDRKPAPEDVEEQLFRRMMLPIAGATGNIRADLITMGFALWRDEDGREQGFVIFIGRGQYDREKIKTWCRKNFRSRPDRPAVTTAGGVEVFYPESSLALLFPSNELAVLVAGPRRDDLPVESFLAALKAGKGTLAKNKDLMALIESVDTKAPIWSVAKLVDYHRREAKFLAPFSAATAVAKRDKKDMVLHAVGHVADAEKLPAALAELREGLAEAKEEIAREVQRMPMLKPVAGFVNSVRIIEKPNQVHMTGRIQIDSPAGILLAPLLMTMGVSASRAERAAEVRAVPAPVQPVPQRQAPR